MKTLRRAAEKGSVRAVHPYAWLWEPLETEPSFVLRAMFGAKAVYLGGQMVLCFSAKTEPWRGVLIATDQARQPALRDQFPMLVPHPILPKWLYLAEAVPSFETTAARLVALVRARDSRIGIQPKVRERKRKSLAPGRKPKTGKGKPR